MTAVFFNLFANSAFSLLCGLMVVGFFIWLFRVETDGWKIFLLSLPFIKIVYDFVRGVSASSILYSTIDPFSLPPKSQTFQVGMGFSQWSPFINGVFKAKDLSGKEYDLTAGDYLLYWINRKFGHEIPLIILVAVLAISLTLVFIRVVQGFRFERRRRRDRVNAISVSIKQVGWRQVDIYRSKAFSGTPFTGGIVRPYVCLPEDAVVRLSEDELKAVIAHELGHIQHFDLAVTMTIKVLGDLFWFVPGYRWLSRKIDRLREIVADRSAIAFGANADYLASALLKLKEIPEPNENFILYSAFFRERSLLKERIERLLGKEKEKQPRLGWQYKWIRVVVCIAAGGAVINSVFGGNHQMILAHNPEWFIKLMNAMGIHELHN